VSTPDPFPMIEVALKQLLERDLAGAEGKVGGDLSYDGVADFYVWIGLVPGGASNALEGTWIVDIDVFSKGYGVSMNKALAIESVLLKPGGHRTSTMRIDSASQNTGPADRPWDDDSVFRVGATYVFTARRSG